MKKLIATGAAALTALTFGSAATAEDITLRIGSGHPPGEDYAIDVQAAETAIGVASDAEADRIVSVSSDGSVSIQPYEETQPADPNE